MADAPTVHAALAAAKAEIGAVGKDQRNTVQNFNFRGIDAVVNAASPALNRHGVIITPRVIDYTYGTVEVGSRRTPMAHVIGLVEYAFHGPAGDSVSAVVVAESMDSGDKAIPKMMSVAFRIALLQVLNLPTTDPDPDEHVYERSPRNAETASAPSRTRSAAKAETAKSAETPKSAETADSGKPRDFFKDAEDAKTTEKLREVWKAAGTAGALKSVKEIEGKNGGKEKVTLEEFLYTLNDKLAGDKSGKAAPGGSGGSGDQ